MPNYNVALWVDDDGSEYREDILVSADDKSDAKTEALERLPRGAKVKKVISVQEVN